MLFGTPFVAALPSSGRASMLATLTSTTTIFMTTASFNWHKLESVRNSLVHSDCTSSVGELMTPRFSCLDEGAADIEEYVKFTFADYSPYLYNDGPILATGLNFLGYDSDSGQCVFRVFNLSGYFLDPVTSAGIPPFDAVRMTKLYLDLKKGYFTRLNVFYPVDFLRVFFEVGLDSDNTRSYVCDVMDSEKCDAIVDSTGDCEGALASLPTLEGPSNHFDGNSQGCRVLHAAFASTNPDPNQHCPHISFAKIPDARDRFKCQDTSSTPPSDLFTDNDFASYRAFSEKNGIDPAVGHDSAF